MKRVVRGPLLALALVGAMIPLASVQAKTHHAHHAKHHRAKPKPINYAAEAKSAFYGGNVSKALAYAPRGGERWIAGLAAYRLKKFDQAKVFFEQVANDLTQDDSLRAAAAFWAARAVTQAGEPEDAAPYLRMAAMSPSTFYGMLAQRQLATDAGAQLIRVASLAGSPSAWSSYDDYPTPELFPAGGFTLDKALVYALVRQESRFNPYAVSNAGAVGLMQLMPAAAAAASGDDNMMSNVIPLFDAPTNLRLGQDYFQWLLEEGVGDYDMLKAVAAYNGGPGMLQKTQKQLGDDANDDLMLIECLPARETRNYVEQVMAAYWTYRKKFGEEARTLDALATGAGRADYRLDKAS
jgi:soluble lytic murein transglycosylase-like protein